MTFYKIPAKKNSREHPLPGIRPLARHSLEPVPEKFLTNGRLKFESLTGRCIFPWQVITSFKAGKSSGIDVIGLE
jgi:hypothetical protein